MIVSATNRELLDRMERMKKVGDEELSRGESIALLGEIIRLRVCLRMKEHEILLLSQRDLLTTGEEK